MSPILLKLLEDFIIVHAKCNMFHTCNLEGKTQEYLQNNVEEHHQLLGCRLCLAQPQFVTRGRVQQYRKNAGEYSGNRSFQHISQKGADTVQLESIGKENQTVERAQWVG